MTDRHYCAVPVIIIFAFILFYIIPNVSHLAKAEEKLQDDLSVIGEEDDDFYKTFRKNIEGNKGGSNFD